MNLDPDRSTIRFGRTATEAANRAEATAHLIRCGFRVYRPEADIEGEDLVVRTPAGELHGVQLKGRPYVEWKRYSKNSVSLPLWASTDISKDSSSATSAAMRASPCPVAAGIRCETSNRCGRYSGRWHRYGDNRTEDGAAARQGG